MSERSLPLRSGLKRTLKQAREKVVKEGKRKMADKHLQLEVVLHKQVDVDGFPQQAQHILIILQFHLIKSSE